MPGQLCASGLVMVAGVCVYQSFTWLPNLSPGQPNYFVQRCLFVMVTATDLPVFPATLAGVAVICGAMFKRRLVGRTVAIPTGSPFAVVVEPAGIVSDSGNLPGR